LPICSENVYTARHERVFKMDNGFYLLYYHNPEFWRMWKLYLWFLVPIVILVKLIRENPFYQSYPIMLPLMVVGLCCTMVAMVRYSKVTNKMVHQVLMDPTGTELTFIYKNQTFRRLRNDKPEQTLMIAQLIDPPQGDRYQQLEGDIFPTEYPLVNPDEQRNSGSYFWRKYYMSQRLFFSFPKQ
jgi:hypothetical protein